MAQPPNFDWIEWSAACLRMGGALGHAGRGIDMEPALIAGLRDGDVRSRREDNGAELDPAFWSAGKARWEADPMLLVEIHRKSLDTWLSSGAATTTGARPGRRTEYDWEGFWIEIAAIANHPDGLPETRAALCNHMEQWFEDQIGTSPSRSLIEERVSKLYRRVSPSK